MSQQQNGLLRMVNKLVRQTRLIVPNQCDAILPGNIFRGNDHEFIPGDFGTECDLVDAAARNLTANRRSEEHVGQNHIVNILRPSGYLVAPFLARNRLADDVLAVHVP